MITLGGVQVPPLPCGIFAEKCSACRGLAHVYYGQFEVPVTDQQVKDLQEKLRNEPGDLLLDSFWGKQWPIGRGSEVGEEIRRRVLAYDRMMPELKRIFFGNL